MNLWTAWIVAIEVAIFSTILLIAMFLQARREKKAWALRMEEIERKHTAALCESKARFARYKMRIRVAKGILERALRRSQG